MNSSIWTIDRTLLGATTPGQSEPETDENKGILSIPQSSTTIGALPSDCLMSHPGHSLGEFKAAAEMQSAYSAAPADWATRHSLGEFYPSAEMQSMYSTALADWAKTIDGTLTCTTILGQSIHWNNSN